MSDIILSTALITADDGSRQVSITAFASDGDWVGHFDRLQFFRSSLGPDGPFEEITDVGWARPRIPSTAGDEPSVPVTGALVNVVGRELKLAVNNTELVVTFTGSDPLTMSQVSDQIIGQSSGLLHSYVDSSGLLVVENNQPGLGSKLEVLDSEGATTLNLPVTSATGRDVRPNLILGQNLYSITDYFGDRSFYYKTRFIDSHSGSQSESSVSSSPRNPIGIDLGNIVIGYLDLVHQSGRANEGAEIHIFNDGIGPLVNGKLVTGTPSVKCTDEHGHVEFPVIRGQRLTISVQGTNYVRTFTVPTDPTVKKFNFFDPGIAEDDIFKVAVPDIITAERRTL